MQERPSQKSPMSEELLAIKPERLQEWEIDERNQRAVILVPKFRNNFFRKLLQQRMKSPFHRIELDDYGTLVWENCDGNTTIEQIGKKLIDKLGNPVQPVYERLTLYVQKLRENKLVRFSNLAEVRREITGVENTNA